MGSTDNTAEIEYMDVEMVVEYDFQPGEPATHWEPGCADEAIINAVYVGGVDIKDIINPRYLADIAERVADSHEEDAADHHADYIISLRKEAA